MVELHGLVHERLRGEAEALLLPVGVLVDLGAQNLLHQVLGVRPVDALRRRICSVRHAGGALSLPKTGALGLLILSGFGF